MTHKNGGVTSNLHNKSVYMTYILDIPLHQCGGTEP